MNAKLSSISANTLEYYSTNFFFEKSFTQANPKTKKARAIFLFANPIEYKGTRYKTYRDRAVEQERHFIDFSDELAPLVENTPSTMKVEFFSITWSEAIIDDLIMKDIMLIFASFACVFIYVAFHLQSLFLASIAMVGIALSYPVTIFINRFILQITVFNFINYIAIFVILGIAADDVFVFTDGWKQSATFKELKEEGDTKQQWLLKRMNYTWRRTSKAILTTSVTT